MGLLRERTFTGCWKCRARKIKCDETKPGCLACGRLGVQCTGYSDRFIWVTDDGRTYKSNGRRLLSCETTWSGFDILSTSVVDYLISQCDEQSSLGSDSAKVEAVHCGKRVDSPFSVFPLSVPKLKSLKAGAMNKAEDFQSYRHVRGEWNPVLSELMTPDAFNHQERFLFHHYLTETSVLMLPYNHAQNPWRQLFPAVALSLASSGERVLYHALLAHAAFHLSQLRQQDSVVYEVGSLYYDLSIKQLLCHIRQDSSFRPETFASILSLMYAEVYRNSKHDWVHHYRGAWALAKKSRKSGLQQLDDLSHASVHSINIIKIIHDTSKPSWMVDQAVNDGGHVDIADRIMQSSALSESGFGLTIGAHRDIMQCITRITRYRENKDHNVEQQDADEFVAVILCILNEFRRKLVRPTDSFGGNEDGLALEDQKTIQGSDQLRLESFYQEGAFVHATYIYLYRTVLDVPSYIVKTYVTQTFAQIALFLGKSSGNFSLWPAFVAAAEAYTDEDKKIARQWLEKALSVGLGARQSIRWLLEEVWHRRAELAQQSGQDAGRIIIDWRAVMQELDTNVLLI